MTIDCIVFTVTVGTTGYAKKLIWVGLKAVVLALELF